MQIVSSLKLYFQISDIVVYVFKVFYRCCSILYVLGGIFNVFLYFFMCEGMPVATI